ncbi:MAG TPA: hypothetical protein PKE05_15975 [Microthrixaceae bacterium]|nr:hypothetical protein [Microthrixaceae bacterium]
MGDPTVPDSDVGASAEPDQDPDPVLRRVSDLVADRNRARTARPVVVGIGGPVCVGKSTYSAALAERLRGQGGLVTIVVAGDGFLWPNAVLAERGILERKGFPESYDLLGASGFLDAVRSGDRDVVAPRYSHEDYDVVEGSEPVGTVDVVIFEGLVVLQQTFGPRLDLGVYLHAEHDVLRGWFVERFVRLVADLDEGSTSVLGLFRGLDETGLRQAAVGVWESYNVPNNRDHIEPMRDGADIVVELGPSHEILRWHHPRGPRA